MLFMTHMLPYLARINISISVFHRMKMKFFGNGNTETKVFIDYVFYRFEWQWIWSMVTKHCQRLFPLRGKSFVISFFFFLLDCVWTKHLMMQRKRQKHFEWQRLWNLCSLSCLAIENIRNDFFLCEWFFTSTRKTNIPFSYDDVGFARFSVYLT